MPLFGSTVLGIVIVFLLGALVVVKQLSTGSVLDKPQGSFLVQLVNIFNLFFLLVVNPLAALGLISLLLQSLGFFGVFVVYLVLILQLIPAEEHELKHAYGADYAAYERRTRKLVPAIY